MFVFFPDAFMAVEHFLPVAFVLHHLITLQPVLVPVIILLTIATPFLRGVIVMPLPLTGTESRA